MEESKSNKFVTVGIIRMNSLRNTSELTRARLKGVTPGKCVSDVCVCVL